MPPPRLFVFCPAHQSSGPRSCDVTSCFIIPLPYASHYYNNIPQFYYRAIIQVPRYNRADRRRGKEYQIISIRPPWHTHTRRRSRYLLWSQRSRIHPLDDNRRPVSSAAAAAACSGTTPTWNLWLPSAAYHYRYCNFLSVLSNTRFIL